MDKNKLHLEIVSPEGKLFSEHVDEVIAPTVNGEIAVLPQHAPLFTQLQAGELRVKRGSKEESIAILGGFLDVNNNTVSVIADYAVHADTINAAEAEKAKRRAEELLSEKKENVDFVEIERDLQRSILELNIADKIRRRNRTS